MITQIELLYTLQTIDTNIKNAEALQRRYQADVKILGAEVKKEEALLEQAEEQLKAAEKALRDRESELAALEDQKKKNEDRVLSIKTNKEYTAALHEIENIKGSISRQEDKILEAMDGIEARKADRREAEAVLGKARSDYEGKKKQIETELATYLAEVEQQKQQREGIINKVDAGLYKDYQKIQTACKGIAVALAEDEQCMGCSMKIPPQVYNEVVFGEKVVMCPSCKRILYVERSRSEAEPGGPAAPSPPGGLG